MSSTSSLANQVDHDYQHYQAPSIFDLFIKMMPYKPYCTNYLPWGLRIRNKESAIQQSYIQLNTKYRTIALVFDLDHDPSAFHFEDVGLPMPTFIVISQENSHAHYIYLLSFPVLERQKKSMRYLSKIKDAYTIKLDADPNYNGLLVKNPLSTTHDYYMWWKTICTNKTYTLDELAEYVEGMDAAECKSELARRRKSGWIDTEYAVKGRNCKLFEIARQFAYNVVPLSTSLDNLFERVLSYLNTHNTGGLPHAELKSISSSIARWTWKNRQNFINRGGRKKTLDLDPSLPLAERQRAGAQYTNQRQRDQTEAKIRAKINELKAQSKRITKALVARLCAVSRDTVYQYLHLFED